MTLYILLLLATLEKLLALTRMNTREFIGLTAHHATESSHVCFIFKNTSVR